VSERAIEITKTIEASPEGVFLALTDADELSSWWTTRAESDPRQGGTFSYTWEFERDAERNHTREDTYSEVSPNKRVSYDWPMPRGNTVVDFRLEPRGEGTELRLIHSGWGEDPQWKSAYDMHVSGWEFFLGNLKSYLERGEDRRASAMGLKTPATHSV
jgi:uncharacterized protein YndB with AHSA1/START domain